MCWLPLRREGALGVMLDCPSLLPVSMWDFHKGQAVPAGAPTVAVLGDRVGTGTLLSPMEETASLSNGARHCPDDASCLESRSLHLRRS